ncbi:MAG: hypothetical protein JNG82_15245 [Opitutaceae bacterium]|nr:hypothetical protein [Opitutaceae bacterium]
MKFLQTHKPSRSAGVVSPAQVGFVAQVFSQLATAVDPTASPTTVSSVKVRHILNKLSRLNLTKADREVAALKDQFRREDQELLRQGRGAEIVARNRRLMGIKEGEKTRLVGFGGVRFE